jgi:hypothetical protein
VTDLAERRRDLGRRERGISEDQRYLAVARVQPLGGDDVMRAWFGRTLIGLSAEALARFGGGIPSRAPIRCRNKDVAGTRRQPRFPLDRGRLGSHHRFNGPSRTFHPTRPGTSSGAVLLAAHRARDFS